MKKMVMQSMLFTLAAAIGAGTAIAGDFPTEKIVRPAGTVPATGDSAELVKLGEQLWFDKSLSKNGKTACATCHKSTEKRVNGIKKTFLDPYPHYVKMAKKKAHLESITAEGMVQFCMIVPMKADTFAWDSKQLAALTAYTVEVVQPDYIAKRTKK